MSRRPASTKKPPLLAPVPFQASLLSVKGWTERLQKRKTNGVLPLERLSSVTLAPGASLAWATNVLDAVPRTPGWMKDHHIPSRVAKLRQMLERPSRRPLQRRASWSRFIEELKHDEIAGMLVLLLATTDIS